MIRPRPSSPWRATSWSKQDLKAVIVRVTIDGQEVVTEALGESMTGRAGHHRTCTSATAPSPSPTCPRCCCGWSTSGWSRLDDPLATWLPDLPDADRVTLRMLANMTAGYPDYVQDPKLSQALLRRPVPPVDPRGADRASASPRRGSSRRGPTGTTRTPTTSSWARRWRGSPASRWTSPCRSRSSAPWACATPSPGRRRRSRSRCCTPSARSGARRSASPPARASTRSRPTGTPPGRSPQGAIQTTDIFDMATTAVAVGEGTLLSPASHQAQIAPELLGFGAPLAGCPTCHTLDDGVQLRARRRPQRRVDPAEPALRRLRRGDGLPAPPEDRDRGGHDLRRGGLRRPGQLQVRQPPGHLRRHRHLPRPGPPAANAQRRDDGPIDGSKRLLPAVSACHGVLQPVPGTCFTINILLKIEARSTRSYW